MQGGEGATPMKRDAKNRDKAIVVYSKTEMTPKPIVAKTKAKIIVINL